VGGEMNELMQNILDEMKRHEIDGTELNMVQLLLRYIVAEKIFVGEIKVDKMIKHLGVNKKDVQALYDNMNMKFNEKLEAYQKSVDLNNYEEDIKKDILRLQKNAENSAKANLRRLDKVLLSSLEGK
jgi:hypothetical protein